MSISIGACYTHHPPPSAPVGAQSQIVCSIIFFFVLENLFEYLSLFVLCSLLRIGTNNRKWILSGIYLMGEKGTHPNKSSFLWTNRKLMCLCLCTVWKYSETIRRTHSTSNKIDRLQNGRWFAVSKTCFHHNLVNYKILSATMLELLLHCFIFEDKHTRTYTQKSTSSRE